jgi:hypothetical protein
MTYLLHKAGGFVSKNSKRSPKVTKAQKSKHATIRERFHLHFPFGIQISFSFSPLILSTLIICVLFLVIILVTFLGLLLTSPIAFQMQWTCCASLDSSALRLVSFVTRRYTEEKQETPHLTLNIVGCSVFTYPFDSQNHLLDRRTLTPTPTHQSSRIP